MTMTQFAMVEELASLIKDNLYCKHLVLSVEEALVNFLQDDTSIEGVLELQPMSPYHRLLLHRLADIYGFAHESVGEGDDRHLVLERCPETAIPSILVSDILWQHDAYESPTPAHHILKRKEVPELKQTETSPSPTTFEEREAAYLAARERIFSLHENDEKEVTAPKSRNIPVVARRMIAHALGTRISSNSSGHEPLIDAGMEARGIGKKGEVDIPSSSESFKATTMDQHVRENKAHGRKGNAEAADVMMPKGNTTTTGSPGRVVQRDNLEREQRGAAKRIFAHALGLQGGKVNQGTPVKFTQGNKSPCEDS